MKIFISHSSKDKWVARRIAEDLEDRGVTTFLDEKDIETGESIDESIQEHLKDSDELLMLLSSAALESTWVLIEVGGAKALGLRLVPIMLHVGANDLPAPISKHLARELNDIEKYYVEVERRMRTSAGTDTPADQEARAKEDAPEPTPARRPEPSFAVGDRVTVLPRSAHRAERNDIGWRPDMDAYASRLAAIVEIDSDASAKLDVDAGRRWWALDWLTPAD